MTSTTNQTFHEFVKHSYNYDFNDFNLQYLSNGLGGEVGEVQNEVKKYYRKYHDLTFKVIDNNQELNDRKDNIKKELGDVLWYIFAISNELNINVDDIIKTNIEKNRGRIKNT